MMKVGSSPRRMNGFLLACAALASCNRSERSTSNAVGLSSANDAVRVAQVGPRPATSSSSADAPVLGISGSAGSSVRPAVSDQGQPIVTIAEAIAQARQGGRTDVEYIRPPDRELASYQRYVVSLLAPTPSDQPSRLDLPLGFSLGVLESNCVGLVEQASARRGAAAIVVRRGEARALAIEVPHSFFDEGTLPIGLELFDVSQARLLIVNTVHRNRAAGTKAGASPELNDDTDTTIPSDAAHASDSFFLAAHAAFVRAVGDGVTVQLHGFRNSSADGYDAVVSAARSPARLEPLVQRLRRELDWRVAVFPQDIRRLGGTTNAQAALSREHHMPFVHIELSQTLRSQLVRAPSLTRQFSAIVAAEVR